MCAGNLMAVARDCKWRPKVDANAPVKVGITNQTLACKLTEMGVDLAGHPTIDLYVHEGGQFIPYQLGAAARARLNERVARYHATQRRSTKTDDILLRAILRLHTVWHG